MSSTPDYALDDQQLLAACRVQRSLSSGPGGQHAQRTRSAVTLVHLSSGLQVSAQQHRDGLRNQQEALSQLRLRLACQQRGQADPAWLTDFRRGARLQVSASNARYHLVVAVCLDALEAAEGQLSAAAAALSCSASQVVKVLALHKEAYAAAQAVVAAHGRGPLRQRS